MHSKFLGKSNDPKYKQQSILAFNNSKDPRNSKNEYHDDDDDDPVQPTKKRKISNGRKEKHSNEDGSMEDEPGTADLTTETNGHLIPEQRSKELFVADDEHGAAPTKKEGKSLIGELDHLRLCLPLLKLTIRRY